LTVEISVPKTAYEKRVDALVEHTNMDRKEAIRPMSLKWEERAVKAKKAEEVEAQRLKDAEPKTKTQERKDAKVKKQEK